MMFKYKDPNPVADHAVFAAGSCILVTFAVFPINAVFALVAKISEPKNTNFSVTLISIGFVIGRVVGAVYGSYVSQSTYVWLGLAIAGFQMLVVFTLHRKLVSMDDNKYNNPLAENRWGLL